MQLGHDGNSLQAGAGAGLDDRRGITLLELLISAAIMAVALLAIANMFPTGYTNISEAGRRTMALTAGRQILEDMRSLPFANLNNLDGFDTSDFTTLPLNEPERTLARRWRYALAGPGDGFPYVQAETDHWATLSRGDPAAAPLGGTARVSVVAVCPTPPCPPNPVSGSLRLITVTITFPGRAGTITLVTRMTNV